MATTIMTHRVKDIEIVKTRTTRTTREHGYKSAYLVIDIKLTFDNGEHMKHTLFSDNLDIKLEVKDAE